MEWPKHQNLDNNGGNSLREKKKFMSILVLSLVLIIVAGTFAWSNFSSQTINQWFGEGSGSGLSDLSDPETGTPGQGISEVWHRPGESEPGGTLHDYHSEDGEYKQTHIENWGNEPLFVRIRLDEYMELGSGAGLHSVATGENTGESIPNPLNLAESLVDGANIDEPRTWKPHVPMSDTADECEAGFHDFWEWEMGGQRYYFPAPEEYRTSKSFVDTSSPPDLTAESVNDVGIRARQTRLAQVWTMVQWKSNGSPIGDFWVIDQDGWAYWASPLNPGESTGLLLNKITQMEQPEEDFFYEINVIVQMASKDSRNYMRFGNEVNGGWTSNGRALVEDIVNHTNSDIGIVVHRMLSLTTANIPDVTYTATPSMGEIITEVSYSITSTNYLLDGPHEEFLFLAGVDGMTAIGTLGTGTLGTGHVLFFPVFDNTIVFTARDSAGNTANYTFHHRGGTDWLIPIAEFVEPMQSSPGMYFVNNRVVAWASSGVKREQIDSLAVSIGGRIIGVRQRRYFIEVGRHTEENLREICEKLMNTGLFSRVRLDILY